VTDGAAPLSARHRYFGRVADMHVHIQPWAMLKPDVHAQMSAKRHDLERIRVFNHDSGAFLAFLDEEGIARVGIVNYPSPDLMGFTHEVNDFVARYCERDPRRLVAIGGIHPRFTMDPAGDVDRIADMGVRGFKIHPPHQLFRANAYRSEEGGLMALESLYRRCMERRLPVMVHTGTSIFAGARNKYADPMDLDDVAIDFPDLTILLAHGGRPLFMDTAFFLVRRHKNVWLDLSSIPPRNLPAYFPKLESIADKCLFGTDWPAPGVRSMRENAEAFLSLPYAEETFEKILVRNAEDVFPSRP
jgi:predicted TIM-barrel fold metal-dependent hydrolase